MNDKKVRRKFSSDFKAKVALEALREQMSIESISKKYELHPNQVRQWKNELLTGSSKVFSSEPTTQSNSSDKLIDELYRQIGQLKVDNDWLKKKALLKLLW